MNLPDQLRPILADILPLNPDAAIRGTELVQKVKSRVDGAYSDNSIRQAFSSLAADATSPIAKIESGHGYYRRQSPQVPISAPDEEPEEYRSPTSDSRGTRANQPEEKFRAFFKRSSYLDNRFPVHIEHTAGARQPAGVAKWKYPDVVELEWDAGGEGEEGFSLDRTLLEVKRSLGEQPFRLRSIELKVELALSNFREHFFQCVSNSMWSHSARLVVAAPVSDALLARELRRLGTSYGVHVQTFNIPVDRIATLPDAEALSRLSDDEFERLRGEFSPLSISPGLPRQVLDWEHIRDMMNQSQEFQDIFEWIARCLRDSRSYSFENYLALRKIEQRPG
jgi:hypothetical protein